MTNALFDAGLVKEQIDGLVVQVGSPRGADYDTISATLGIDAGFCAQTWGHGRFAATVIAHAAMAIASGMATRVACVMGMKNSDLGRIGEANNPFYHEQFRENGGPHGEEGHLGMASPVAGAAMAFDLYCQRYGYDRELLAAIPMTFRANAGRDPEAVMRDPMTIDDYRGARPIVDPLRLLDCSPVGDGAICLIVSKAIAADHRAVVINGAQGIRAGRDTFIFGPVGLGMSQQSTRRMTLTEARTQIVYAQAGISPDDVDLLGLYDSFSPLPLYALEDFGFCGAGEALGWVQDDRIGLHGELPVNTNGGQLSHAQMNGWGQIRELVTQLRGEGGTRQVAGCRRAMWATPAGDALILERG
ncbi:thiolase family protein [Croceicoccus ponticola]|uniref:thiolase family protein n=1 Tax=Croceicoccus ponticola TaxID=2217664 RepID=UPI0013E36CB0|nr:thiolase family protein [Croceicoccus ponticola]